MRPGLMAIVLLFVSASAFAHEVRPAYLELREEKRGEVSVLFKTPMRGEMKLALAPELSGTTENITPVAARRTGDAMVQTWRLRTAEPLPGQSLQILGLEATMTDALVRIVFADGATWIHRLTPQEPASVIPAQQSVWAVAGSYLRLGVEHILGGIDHLLFVLALLLLVNGWRRVVGTVTAFTIAHSFTLAAAALGVVHVPPKPVEAVIALSIMFVAVEIVHGRQGKPGLTVRWPWVVAFTFGLLHGFGFASALSEVGLPQQAIPVALFFFNVGVELGQLLFIAAVFLAVAGVRQAGQRVSLPRPTWAWRVPPYAIGSMAAFWMIQRIAAF